MASVSDHADALNSRGMALRRIGRIEEALDSYQQALAIRPDYADALNNIGNVLAALGRPAEALASYDRALAIHPDFADALNNRGNVLRELGRLEEALASHDRALAIRPGNAAAFNNRGLVLRELGQLEAALASHEQALAMRPGYAEAICNRGIVLRELGRIEEALASCDAALAIRPGMAEALVGRAGALRDLGRLDEALESCDRALAARPGFTDALVNRGIVLQYQGRLEAALACYAAALAIRPGDAAAHWNEALCRLLAGDFAAGWRQYEWRWRRGGANAQRRFDRPLWLGETDIAGRTVLLHAEQGYGDTIQFCRYAPLLAARGARVILEVPPALRSLLSDLAGVWQVVGTGDHLENFDVHCPLGSLPLAFGTTAETIPARIPYLAPRPADVRRWPGAGGQRIGIAWSGNPVHPNDRNRSIPLARLAPLLACGASFVGLQQDVRDTDRQWLAAHPGLLQCEALADFADTAALMSVLDLVISVDTAVAHLAGAIGKPVWILLPAAGVDWRWRQHGDASAWYPSARLFRQRSPGDWDGVIGRVVQALRP